MEKNGLVEIIVLDFFVNLLQGSSSGPSRNNIASVNKKKQMYDYKSGLLKETTNCNHLKSKHIGLVIRNSYDLY